MDFTNFGESIQTLDAMAITHELKITGNDKANLILGSSTKANTIQGGGGDDTLQGGSKADIFVYTEGDGNDKIIGYDAGDIISIVSGIVDYNHSKENETVVLKIGNGNISITGAAGKYLSYYDKNGQHQKKAVAKFLGDCLFFAFEMIYNEKNFSGRRFNAETLRHHGIAVGHEGWARR